MGRCNPQRSGQDGLDRRRRRLYKATIPATRFAALERHDRRSAPQGRALARFAAEAEKRLEWTRVAEFYHASERIWTMAEVLFGKGPRRANAWARRMLKSLKKPSGASRVLRSAASHFNCRQAGSRDAAKMLTILAAARRRTCNKVSAVHLVR